MHRSAFGFDVGVLCGVRHTSSAPKEAAQFDHKTTLCDCTISIFLYTMSTAGQ